jgi:hypothetical protein
MDCVRTKCLHNIIKQGDINICTFNGIPITYFIEAGVCWKEMNTHSQKKIKSKFYDDPVNYRHVYGRFYDKNGQYHG